MSMQELDILRGWAIAAVLIALVVMGLVSKVLAERHQKAHLLVNGFAGTVGGLGGLTVFFLFTFVAGWDEYFASKSSGELPKYRGRHQAAARVIRTLADMDVSTLGIIFGVLGTVLLVVAFRSIQSWRRG